MTNDDASERQDERSQLRRLQVASLVETTTLLLLLVTVPLRHFGGYANAVHVMGPIHGIAFLAYAWMAVQTVSGGGWTAAESTRLLLGGLISLGGYFNIRLVARKASALA